MSKYLVIFGILFFEIVIIAHSTGMKKSRRPQSEIDLSNKMEARCREICKSAPQDRVGFSYYGNNLRSCSCVQEKIVNEEIK